jgi:ankyrin repeat protein
MFVAIAGAAGDSALTKAARAGDVQAVRALIKSGADVNAKSGDGSTPLLWAASSSSHEIATVLIAAKATGDTPNDFGVTPLLHASRIGDAAMVDLLLKAGASPSLQETRDGDATARCFTSAAAWETAMPTIATTRRCCSSAARTAV